MQEAFDLYGLLPDRECTIIVVSNCSRVGECRNDENQSEAGMASR